MTSEVYTPYLCGGPKGKDTDVRRFRRQLERLFGSDQAASGLPKRANSKQINE